MARIRRAVYLVKYAMWDCCCGKLWHAKKTFKKKMELTSQNMCVVTVDERKNCVENNRNHGTERNEDQCSLSMFEDFITNPNVFICVPIAEAEKISEDFEEHDDKYSICTETEYNKQVRSLDRDNMFDTRERLGIRHNMIHLKEDRKVHPGKSMEIFKVLNSYHLENIYLVCMSK